ncbi:MAG: class I SAM-dependent methyltransferase [Spirochaetes bacterium]|nr:class I SAM-dependent methyltransferase [Spirochaetota bacterium]
MKQPKGVEEYIEMCQGYDNSQFANLIKKHLPANAEMLEIGMGPGIDSNWLSKDYKVTGSDYSSEFIKRAKKRFDNGVFTILDAVKLDIDKKFDAIYSCKVYQYFEIDLVESALCRQHELLRESGIIIHSFWIGDSVFEQDDVRAFCHNKDRLTEIIEKNYKILEEIVYEEFEPNDSLFVLARKVGRK